ncbi:MAG TPA: trimethylamine corrinoid protein 2 [Anaerolineae bacterium]|nr:trimethylamine corrinoid protein 2 [Anaerolineae bacterium]HQI83271.1 trimethylamine corrinoid protein 2 [Anaerolineae bacterium]
MFELKPDFEIVLDRYEAWWDCAILDRPLTSITFPKPPEAQTPWPEKEHATLRARWLDTEFVVARTVAEMRNRVFYADALPIAWPNLGPEVFSAFYGCPLEFGETTSWSAPILADWSPESTDKLRLDTDNFYYRKILELTNALLEAAQGKFIVGYTDMHPGGDALAAFRDPQQLCIDMIEHPAEIKALVERVTDDFLAVYDVYYNKLSAAGMPSTSWLPATCRGKYHIPSNDFSCMVSGKMFEAIFLPGLIRECQHMDRNIYHLDGPQALRFLDTLLAVPEIHAIQWVAGAGRDYWADWVHVYRRIQAAGKAFCIYLPVEDLDRVFEALRPEGAWLILSGVYDQDMADAALQKIARWK